MIITRKERERLRSLNLPPSAEVRAALREYLARTGMNYEEFGERVGYRGKSLRLFCEGQYGRVCATDGLIREAVWSFLERHPIEPRRTAPGRLFETENYRRVRHYFERAIERGEICLLYGPPGTQKTFLLEYLITQRNREKKHDAFYIYASARMSPYALLSRIARESGCAGSRMNNDSRINGLVRQFSAMRKPPAIIVDEAQHLRVETLEVLRELHDRCGCGLILAGSHNLFENFIRGRSQLEQWLSRIDHKDPLPGLLEKEVTAIASRELGNGQPAKLSEKQIRAITDACRVDDVFARDSSGKAAARKYLSCRRLVKILAQYKEAKGGAAAKEQSA